MHVLHYVPNFHNPTGGREIFVRGLTHHLQKYKISQSVITNSNNGTKVEVSQFDHGTPVVSLPIKKLGAYSIVANLEHVLRDSKWDIINIHGYGEYAGDLACISKRFGRLNIPLVLTTHGIAGLKNGYLAFDSSLCFTSAERMSDSYI